MPPLETQQPTQQFVTSDPTPPPVTVTATTHTDQPSTDTSASTPSPPATLPAPPISPPTPVAVASDVQVPAIAAAPTISATALGLGAPKEEIPTNPFYGGLDIANFMRCEALSIDLCRQSKNGQEFSGCLAQKNKLPLCKQFVAFATFTSMSPKDRIDVIKHYKQLDLLHLVRFGANYPGVYYTIGLNGDFIDLIFGQQTAGLDIQKDPHYPEIVGRYPNVALFSIVDKLPKAENLPDSAGLQLILRFQLLNGCHACERAGYANIAYTFSEIGAFQSASIQSLEPAS
jgi:hypothetical protein